MIYADKKQFIIFSVLCGVIVSFLLLAYYPLSRKMKTSKLEKQQYAKVNKDVYDYAVQIPQLNKDIQQLSTKIGDMNLKIPEGRCFADFWKQITDVMNHCDLADKLVRPGEEIKGKSLSCIPIDLECSGRLSQVFEFFRAIEKFDRIIRIEQIKMNNDQNLTGNIKVQAKAMIYYRD